MQNAKKTKANAVSKADVRVLKAYINQAYLLNKYQTLKADTKEVVKGIFDRLKQNVYIIDNSSYIQKIERTQRRFDSKSFIEHLYYPERYLEEAFRVLKPGGILITLTPDWESNYRTYYDDYTHKTPFTTVSLRDSYKIHGFENIRAIKFRQLPIVWRFPILNYFCRAISPLIPVRTKNKFLRWSRELMLIGSGYKPK